ncbi:hypothetical protein JZ751_012961 [Albula glossodonta]|uniref:Uncharacterized protein n=1 Tax=Albula glossodonta TaxID=121402 RepID=A0A8T2N427_9TELE|nr:hypothetical protein JZ751_012961 [Albula glossodonta]
MDCEHASSVTQQLLLQSPNQPVPQPHQQRNVHRTATPPKPKKSVFEASLAKIKASSSAPNLSGKSGSTHFGSRLSSFTQGSGRDVKPEKRKQTGKTMPTVAGAQKRRSKSSGLGKLSEPGSASHDQAKDSNFTPDKPSPSDSSSEKSDCTSEENKLSTTSSDTECRSRCEAEEGEGREELGSLVPDRNVKGHQRAKTPVDRDLTPVPLGQERREESLSPSDERSFVSTDSRLNFRASFTFSDLQEEFMNSMHDEFIREMEELRSENEYLKLHASCGVSPRLARRWCRKRLDHVALMCLWVTHIPAASNYVLLS